jgi:hypothetical protein
MLRMLNSASMPRIGSSFCGVELHRFAGDAQADLCVTHEQRQDEERSDQPMPRELRANRGR